jgi:thiol-disulfide isomerase/thioredoxin
MLTTVTATAQSDTSTTVPVRHDKPGVPAVEITLAGGPLMDQLKRQADSAAVHGQLVLIDVGAPWCAPCQTFQHTLSDSVMVQSLKGVRLVHLDFDTWYDELVKHGYLGTYDLPELFLLTRDGGKGESFEKGRWLDYADSVHTQTTAQAFGPPLRAFLMAARKKTP